MLGDSTKLHIPIVGSIVGAIDVAMYLRQTTWFNAWDTSWRKLGIHWVLLGFLGDVRFQESALYVTKIQSPTKINNELGNQTATEL